MTVIAPVANLHPTSQTLTSISVAWNAAPGGPKYDVWLGSVYLGRTRNASYVFSGLACGTSYSLGVTVVAKKGTSATVRITAATTSCPAPVVPSGSNPPPATGYTPFADIQLPGDHASLPDSETAAGLVTSSTWEPRPWNTKRNNVLVDPVAVAAAFAARPLAVDNNYDDLWDSWLLPRVDGQFQGTTDEIFQWAALKWGFPDNLLRGIAVRESTWHQYLEYADGYPVVNWGCGDMFPAPSADTKVFMDYVDGFGRNYQALFGDGMGPKTYSIVGCMSWEAPSWGQMDDNQNGTFPFNRNSTAFAVDYLAGHLRGVYEGWEHWLKNTGSGTYAAGDIWGAVGSWYSGDWHSAAADGYISRVQAEINALTWLGSGWPSNHPSISAVHGAPGADTIPL